MKRWLPLLVVSFACGGPETPVCGDSTVDPGEACDDGNTTDGDGCKGDCSKLEVCGDNTTDPQEECDDGNTITNDGCNDDCTLSCGDGVVSAAVPEGCDDGNRTDGDGCSSECAIESGFSCTGQPSQCFVAPIAADDAFTTNEDTPLVISSLLANDTDPEGGALSISAVNNATNGTASLSGGNVTFTPATNFPTNNAFTGSFEYTLTSSSGGTDTGLVTITVNAIADQPSLQANDVIGDEDSAIALDASSSLVDSDGSETLALVLSGLPAGAQLSAGTPSGADVILSAGELNGLALTPPADFNGDINLSLAATTTESSNADAATQSASFIVTVSNVNDAPIANAEVIVGLLEDTPIAIPGSLLLANDTDVDGDLLAIVSVQNEINCAVSINGSNLTITGDPNFSGDASFEYTVSDGNSASSATMSLNIEAVADSPALQVADASGAQSSAIPLSINASLVDTDGSESLSLSIQNIPAGSSISAGTLLPPAGTGSVNPRVEFAVGASPAAVAVGRFNADAFDDLVTTNTDNTMRVLLGNGDGTFGAATSFGVGSDPRFASVGRLNNDSFDDVVVSNQNSNSVSVLLGNGDGTFGAKTDFGTGNLPRAVLFGRFNNDAFLDLATPNFSSNNVSILLGNGDGTFGAQTTLALGVGAQPFSVAVGRFNNDAFDDIATANFGNTSVSVLLGNGDGTFGPKTNFTVGTQPRTVLVINANADTFDDLAVANQGSNNVSILLGNGDGTFGAQTTFATGAGSSSMRAGRLNGDAFDDLAVINPNSGTVSVLLGNGDGTFAPKIDATTNTNPSSIALGNFNADAATDLVVANIFQNNVSIFLGVLGGQSVSLTANQLAGLTLTAPAGFAGIIPLLVTAIATEASNNSFALQSATLNVTVLP